MRRQRHDCKGRGRVASGRYPLGHICRRERVWMLSSPREVLRYSCVGAHGRPTTAYTSELPLSCAFNSANEHALLFSPNVETKRPEPNKLDVAPPPVCPSTLSQSLLEERRRSVDRPEARSLSVGRADESFSPASRPSGVSPA